MISLPASYDDGIDQVRRQFRYVFQLGNDLLLTYSFTIWLDRVAFELIKKRNRSERS